jgi:hypothetical protein
MSARSLIALPDSWQSLRAVRNLRLATRGHGECGFAMAL